MTFELVKECLKTKEKNGFFEDIEEDVLANLFSEIEDVESISQYQINEEEENLNRTAILPGIEEDSYGSNWNLSDCESDLMNEACSVSFLEENLVEPPESFYDFLYNGEDVDDYYNFFIENNLNTFPVVFDDIVDSLMEHLDEETADEMRGEIVRQLCDKVGRHKLRRRQ